MLTGRFHYYNNGLDDSNCFTRADILCLINNVPVIYTGMVDDYNLKKDGSLDYISLKSAFRAPVEKLYNNRDLAVSDYYELPGTILVIKGDEIKNICCHYLTYPEFTDMWDDIR